MPTEQNRTLLRVSLPDVRACDSREFAPCHHPHDSLDIPVVQEQLSADSVSNEHYLVEHGTQEGVEVPLCSLPELGGSGPDSLSDLKKTGLQDGADGATGPVEKAKSAVKVKIGPTCGYVEDSSDAAGAEKWHTDVGVKVLLLDARSQVARVLREGLRGDGRSLDLHESGKALSGLESSDL
jgi:hypothetical protein